MLTTTSTIAVEYTEDAELAIAIEAQRKVEGRKTLLYKTDRLEVIRGYEEGADVPDFDTEEEAKTFVVISWI